jgi:hypothetical protein
MISEEIYAELRRFRKAITMANDNLSRRSFLATTGVLLGTSLGASPQAPTPSLKDAYRSAFLIGAALDFRRPDEFNAADLAKASACGWITNPPNDYINLRTQSVS